MTPLLTRRSVMMGLAGLGLGLAGTSTEAAEQARPADVAESLQRLKEGNARFMDERTRHAHESAAWRKHLTAGQQPFATILGCSDSRVPIELVFDQGFGDLFVVRVAGNVIAPDVVGTIEYAVVHLKTSLVVILGHEGCGAVTAAVETMAGPSRELPGIKKLIELIEPGLPKLAAATPLATRVSQAVEANVRWSVKQMAAIPEVKTLVADGRITILGGVYELATGRVRFLD